jgi:hypothetical protein
MWFDIEIRKFEYEHSYAAVLFCSYFIYAGIAPILRAALLYIKKIKWGKEAHYNTHQSQLRY